ncbi:MAG: hypothetical protein LBQ57_05675 [Spirochaetales bacterium]|nr:hypothetical protein [Spirochaetales bacterium]
MKMLSVFMLMILLAAAGAVHGEDSALLPEKTLRLSLAPSFGFQVQEWDDEGKVTLFNTGLAIEYGVTGWLTAQALWIPGINVWSGLKTDLPANADKPKFGLLMDPFLGFKAGIMGAEALIVRNDMRLSLAAGVKAPMAATEEREGDRHLWGSSIRAYYDYIITPVYYLNTYLEAVYYPDQWSDNPAYTSRTVYHPLDITLELENRFRYPVDDTLTLQWGLPLTCGVAPWINRNTGGKGMESQYSFSAGAFFMVSFVKTAVPFDLSLRYSAPFAGRNEQPVHRLTLMGRVYITH